MGVLLVWLVTCFMSFTLQGIMLVYDIANENSFDNIKNWIRDIEEVHVLRWWKFFF